MGSMDSRKGLIAVELVAVEDLGGVGGVVEVAAEDVPAGEDEVVELGDGGEVLDEGGAVVGALAEADGAHLGEGADGLGEAAADGFDAGDEGGGDGSHAGDHDAEFSCGRLDAGRVLAGGFGCGHVLVIALLWCDFPVRRRVQYRSRRRAGQMRGRSREGCRRGVSAAPCRRLRRRPGEGAPCVGAAWSCDAVCGQAARSRRPAVPANPSMPVPSRRRVEGSGTGGEGGGTGRDEVAAAEVRVHQAGVAGIGESVVEAVDLEACGVDGAGGGSALGGADAEVEAAVAVGGGVEEERELADAGGGGEVVLAEAVVGGGDADLVEVGERGVVEAGVVVGEVCERDGAGAIEGDHTGKGVAVYVGVLEAVDAGGDGRGVGCGGEAGGGEYGKKNK